MKKILISISIFAVSILFMSGSVFAKVLPRYSTVKKTVSTSKSVNATSYVTAKLRADRKALLVTFINLQNVKSIDYVLTYNGSNADQGVTGSVDMTSAGNSVSREIVFGTESHGVYTYHTNIKDMHFVVTIVLKTGKTVVKKYIVKP